jgi:hypothetical protein
MISFALILSVLPLGGAIEFAGDEGLLVMRSLLWSHGYSLYREIWSDQPPLLTVLLGAVFRQFGPSILVARLMVGCFGLLLLGALFALITERHSNWSGGLGTLLLLGSPVVLQLCVSALPEVPAFALALTSAWFLFRWTRTLSLAWAGASAIVMGIALALKASAFLLWPAMLVEFVRAGRQQLSGRQRRVACHAVLWALAGPAVSLAVCSLSAATDWQLVVGTHLVTKPVTGLPQPGDFGFLWSMMIENKVALGAALLGTSVALYKRQTEKIAFPLVMIGTVCVVHLVHRPIWDYYYLHLAIPLGWLGGVFAGSLQAGVWKGSACQRVLISRRVFFPLAAGALAAIMIHTVTALASTAIALRSVPRIENSPILKIMKTHQPKPRWVFADPVIYAFHAHALVPPELAVLSLKRYWSGQMSEETLLERVKHYQPEQIIVRRKSLSQAWADCLGSRYALVYQGESLALYFLVGGASAESRQHPEIAQTWLRQITTERGLEAVHVAALRSVGVPARLTAHGRAEFWAGSAWQAAPRPVVERWQ